VASKRSQAWSFDVVARRLTGAHISLALRERAQELGFDLIGFGPAAPFDEERELFLDRIGAGFFHGMGWITPERARLSCDPEALLPGARTVIALGVSYAPPEPEPRNESLGWVARYARGLDYHEVIPPRLKALVELIGSLGGEEARSRPFVDNGPLVDRAAARRAGVGFYGKNTCLLTGPHGSYVFLSAILTTLELPSDPLVTKGCGSCRACLDACPTDALRNPGELDATRCVSYLTIEHRGSIPRELRQGLGRWVFGCDICQEVCPWNRARPRGVHPEFAASQGVGPELDPVDLLSLDQDQFSERFRHTAVKRAKRSGLLRNAAVVLGNLGDPAAEKALVQALRDADPLVREHAAWALGQIRGLSPAASKAIQSALQLESDESVRSELESTLASLGAY
jgi:epoxyqueuosine reductase